MTVKEQLIYAIELYKNGGFSISDFCEIFSQLYYYEAGGYKYFSPEERKKLDRIGEVASRHTTDEEDICKYPKTYYSDKRAKCVIDEILTYIKFVR